MNKGQNVLSLMTVDCDCSFENIFRELRPEESRLVEIALQASRLTMLELLSSVGGFRSLRQSCVLYILSNAINALIQTLSHIIRCDAKQYGCLLHTQ